MVLLISVAFAHAQGVSDLFGQAGKQKQYYLQQIAAYHAFESELKMGYNVMRHGLSGIADINTAELNAHAAYYASLKQPVTNNGEVQDILQWQTEISNSFSQHFTGLTAGEQNYVVTVKTNLLSECNKDLTDLQNLLSPRALQMSGGERLERLNRIHADMQDKYRFTRSFCNWVKLLATQRQQSINDLQSLQHEIN